MRVLLLRRAFRGGLAALVDDMALLLPRNGFSAVIEEGTWIPRETGPLVDREVRRQLRDLSDSFDLIHVFGYRAAWACADTFGDSIYWFFTAYEPPPDNQRLAERLKLATHGFSACSATQVGLSQLGVETELSYPGVSDATGIQLGREETRAVFELGDAFTIGAMADEGLSEAVAGLPDVRLILADTNAREVVNEGSVRRVGWYPRPRDLMRACDLWVAPDRRKGFVRNVAEAMWEGRPVLVRDTLREMVEEDVSGFVFRDDGGLADRIAEIRGLDLMRQTVGSAAAIRAHDLFNAEQRVTEIAQRYRDLVQEEL